MCRACPAGSRRRSSLKVACSARRLYGSKLLGMSGGMEGGDTVAQVGGELGAASRLLYTCWIVGLLFGLRRRQAAMTSATSRGHSSGTLCSRRQRFRAIKTQASLPAEGNTCLA